MKWGWIPGAARRSPSWCAKPGGFLALGRAFAASIFLGFVLTLLLLPGCGRPPGRTDLRDQRGTVAGLRLSLLTLSLDLSDGRSRHRNQRTFLPEPDISRDWLSKDP